MHLNFRRPFKFFVGCVSPHLPLLFINSVLVVLRAGGHMHFTLDEAEPYGVYFFQSSMLRVLTLEGIRPKKKSQPGRSSLLKVQPTDNPGPVGSSQLRGRSDACFLIDMHASIKAGTEWIMYTNDGCYGTDHIPMTPQFLLVAFRFTPRGSEEIWSAHSAVAPAANTHTPTAFLPHSSSIGSAQQDSPADVRLRATGHRRACLHRS